MPASFAASIRFRSFGDLDGLPSKTTVNVSFAAAGRRGTARDARRPARASAALRLARPTRQRLCSTWCSVLVAELRRPTRATRRDRRVGEHADRHAVGHLVADRARAGRCPRRAPRRPRSASRTLSSQGVPSRHGVHWPHDSWAKNFARFCAASTMQVSSSITMIAAEPSIEPFAASAVEVERAVLDLGGRQHRRRGAAGDDRLELACRPSCPGRSRRRR